MNDEMKINTQTTAFKSLSAITITANVEL